MTETATDKAEIRAADSRDTIDLIEDEIPRMRRYARSLTGTQDEADDLVQETLTRALAKIALWTPGTNMRAWLFTIMHNMHISNKRRQQRRPQASWDISPENPGPPQVGNQLDTLSMAEVQNAFEQLSEDHREVLYLIVIEGMSYEQAAEVLDCAIGTVRSRLSRARESLRQVLESGSATAATYGRTAAQVEDAMAHRIVTLGEPS
jgi:RNA polymerase sigma-70 factor (ECF subfamily)